MLTADTLSPQVDERVPRNFKENEALEVCIWAKNESWIRRLHRKENELKVNFENIGVTLAWKCKGHTLNFLLITHQTCNKFKFSNHSIPTNTCESAIEAYVMHQQTAYKSYWANSSQFVPVVQRLSWTLQVRTLLSGTIKLVYHQENLLVHVGMVHRMRYDVDTSLALVFLET